MIKQHYIVKNIDLIYNPIFNIWLVSYDGDIYSDHKNFYLAFIEAKNM